MTEGTQVFLLPISTSDSTKEPLSTVTSQAQDSSLSANRPVTEKQQEEAEWESISRLLVTRGFKPLCLVKGANLRDFIVFDKQIITKNEAGFQNTDGRNHTSAEHATGAHRDKPSA